MNGRNDRLERKRKIFSALNLIAQNWRRSDEWIERAIPLWDSTFGDVPAGPLNQAVRLYVSTGSKPPTIADIVQALEAVGYKRKDRSGCKACSGSGFREIAWHRMEGERHIVTTSQASCDCPLGSKTAGSARNWREAVDDYESRPNTISVFFSTEQKPHLPLSQRRVLAKTAPKIEPAVQGDEFFDDLPF